MQQILDSISVHASNPWVVGIGASTVSGVIVWFITQRLFSTREDKEYIQKVSSANTEVIYALRPLISEYAFPSTVIVDSVISATSKKFGIRKESMNSPMQFFDELVKEVMDSNFISPQKKIEYCNHLHTLKTEAVSNTQPKAIGTDLDAASIAKKENLFDALSVSMAIMTTLTISFTAFAQTLTSSTSSILTIFLPVVAALITSLVSVFFLVMTKEPDVKDLARIFFTFEDSKNREK
jgi:hypothetical protein